MDLRLDEQTASFSVTAFWEPPAERTHKVANLSIVNKRKKRGRNSSDSGGYALKLSLWTAARSPSDVGERPVRPVSTRKSFSRVYDISRTIPGCVGPAKVLNVASVIEESTQLMVSFAAVGFPSSSGAYAIMLVEVGMTDWCFRDIGQVDIVPKQVIILRGPLIVIRSSEQIQFLSGDDDGGASDFPSFNRGVDMVLAGTDRDTRAAVISRQSHSGESEYIVQIFDWTGTVMQEMTVESNADLTVTLGFVSFEWSLILLISDDGGCVAYDLSSQSKVWQTLPHRDCTYPLSMTILWDILLFTFASSSLVWHTRLSECPSDGSAIRRLSSLFPNQCDPNAMNEHAHFYAPWRSQILQLHEVSGVCCHDHDYTSSSIDREMVGGKDGAPSLSLVTEYLEQRVDEGVERLVEQTEQYEEKVRMHRYVTSLLSDMARGPDITPTSGVFSSGLKPVVFKTADPNEEGTENGKIQDRENIALGTHVWAPGQSVISSPPAQLIQLLGKSCNFDASELFVVLNVKVSVLPQEPLEGDREAHPLQLRLNVRFNKTMPSIWNVNVINGLRAGQVVWLSASTLLANIVNSKHSVNNLSIRIRVDENDGRSQLLGCFSLCNLLSAGAAEQRPQRPPHPFLYRLYIAARGPEVHKLRDNPLIVKVLQDKVQVRSKEEIAVICMAVTSGVDLSTTVARLRMAVDERVRFHPLLSPSSSSLAPIDGALCALDAEMSLLRSIIEDKDTVGFLPDNIRNILQQQLMVDEAFGAVQEMLLGF